MIESLQAVIPRGTSDVAARWFGSSARIVFCIDAKEELRRLDADCGAVTKAGLLVALSALPVGVTVPRDLLRSSTLRLIDSAPESAVDVDFTGVTRLLTPVTIPRLAIVEERNWRVALDRATRFAPFCQRMIAIERMPPEVDELMLEARLYGIGVLVDGELVLPPAPYDDRRYSPQRWLLAERVFERHLKQGNDRAPRTPSV